MAIQTLDVLTYPLANYQQAITFNDVNLEVIAGARTALDESKPVKLPGSEVPAREFAPGTVIIEEYCDEANGNPLVGVTVVSIGTYPFARVDQDPAATQCALPPTSPGDLTGEISYQPVGSTVTISVNTSHPPFRARLGTVGSFVEGQTVFAVVPGQQATVSVKDALNYGITLFYSVPGPGGGGGPIDPEVDQFTTSSGLTWRVYYYADYPRRITADSLPPDSGHAGVSTAERGRAMNSVITSFCEGTTRVRIRARLGYPYAYLEVVENSVDCGYVAPTGPLVLLRLTPVAPLPQQATGSVQLETLGGVLPVTVTIAGVTAQPEPVDAFGYLEISGIAPGDYEAIIRDSAGAQISQLFTISAASIGGCMDAKATNRNPLATYEDGSCVYAPPAPARVFQAPLLNPLRFVPVVDTDTCAAFETADNVLFCQQTRLGHRVRPLYYQKVQRCDKVRVQVLSNYTAVTATVRTHRGGTQVLTQAATRVQQLTGTALPLTIQLFDNGDGWTQLRAADQVLPENLLQTGRVVLSGGVSGTYLVRARQKNPANGEEYLVIGRPWQPTSSLDVLVQWELTGPGFDVWETTLDLGGLPEDNYQVELTGARAGWPTAVLLSEPLSLADEHEGTVVVEYKNTDNAYGMVWTTAVNGVLPRLRVEAAFFRLKPAGTLNVHRNSNGSAALLASTAQRKILLETLFLPDYLHEKLYLICRLDYLRVNGRRFVTDEVYQVTEQRAYPLTGGVVALEQVDWLGAGNGDDAGLTLPPATNNYLKVNDDYLKLTVR